MRPAAIAGASGGFASLALGILREAVNQGNLPEPFTCPLCCEVTLFDSTQDLEVRSLLIGVLVGFSLGPIIDFLFVLRQIWGLRLRRWLHRAPVNRAQHRVLA